MRAGPVSLRAAGCPARAPARAATPARLLCLALVLGAIGACAPDGRPEAVFGIRGGCQASSSARGSGCGYATARCPGGRVAALMVLLLSVLASKRGWRKGLRPGTRVGPYEVLGILGAGGMGEVFRARDTRLGREVALKVLPAAFAGDADRLRRFEQEARAAGALNHPNVLAVFDVGEHEGTPYLVAELLEGETLRGRLRGGRLPPRKAFDCAGQIARGLAAAHDKGIIHRDLKPENLFVTGDGRVKILDFGLAKAVSGEGSATESTCAETEPGAVLGTAGYMAPEQVRGKPSDLRADIFALGAVFYEMLAGRRAFEGDSDIDRALAILNNEPPPLAEAGVTVPPAVQRVIERCLEKEPSERFQSARDLGFALEALSDASRTGARAIKAAQPRRATVVLVLTALLVVFGVGGVLAGRGVERRTLRRAIAQASQPESAPTFRRVTFRNGIITAGRFAEDSRSVVYAAELQGEPLQVYVGAAGRPEARTIGSPWSSLYAVSRRGDAAMMVMGGRDWRKSVLARASIGGGPPREIMEDVAWADFGPDGDTLLVVKAAGGRSRLEYPPGKALVETGGGIDWARVSPSGQHVAFMHHPTHADRMGTVELVTMAGERRTLAGPYLQNAAGLAWRPDGREVWFSASTNNARTLYAATLDGRLRTVLATPVRVELQDIAPDGRVLITQNDVRRRIAGLVPGREREADLSWLDGSVLADLSADGRTLLIFDGLYGAQGVAQVYLRPTDGGPAVHLGPGRAFSLSPDGRWALVAPKLPYNTLALYPTGPGEVRSLAPGRFEEIASARWLVDGKRIVMAAREPGRPYRLWIQDVTAGVPRLVHEREITELTPPSPDGRHVIAKLRATGTEPAGWFVVPLDGGSPRPCKVPRASLPIQWTADGRSLFMADWGGARPSHSIEVSLVSLATGERRPWRSLVPPDIVGVRRRAERDTIRITPDGRWYAYGYSRFTADLFVVEGLR
jgi:eukaryotic-like serine/threonine-protein kinase